MVVGRAGGAAAEAELAAQAMTRPVTGGAIGRGRPTSRWEALELDEMAVAVVEDWSGRLRKLTVAHHARQMLRLLGCCATTSTTMWSFLRIITHRRRVDQLGFSNMLKRRGSGRG